MVNWPTPSGLAWAAANTPSEYQIIVFTQMATLVSLKIFETRVVLKLYLGFQNEKEMGWITGLNILPLQFNNN